MVGFITPHGGIGIHLGSLPIGVVGANDNKQFQDSVAYEFQDLADYEFQDGILAKLTARTQNTTLAAGDFIHVVDISDTAQDAAGSSYKVPLSALQTFVDEFQPASLSDITSVYMYFGDNVNGDANWRIRRVVRASGTATIANMGNNGGYATLATAWTDRESLTYA